jgi:putative ABC transport system permease protein
MIAMIKQFKIALRFLRKNAAFSLLTLAGLAIGFTCSIFIFLHVSKEKSYNKIIPEHERVFYLLQKSPDSPLGNTTISYALPVQLSEHFPEIENYARTENFSSFSNCVVSYQPEGKDGLLSFNEHEFCLADKELFEIAQYPFIEGSSEMALKETNSIELSKTTAQKYFGNEKALGKTLIFNNDQFFTVSGVVDIPQYVTFTFSMVAPLSSFRSEEYLKGWDSNGQPLFKLNKNVDYKAFNKKIQHFYAELKPANIQNPELLTLSLLPAAERRLYYNKNPLYLLIFVGVVVLVVSILNYVNLSTSMVQKRTSEIALKKISGAAKGAIGVQFFQETAIIGFMAVMLGGFLTVTGHPVFKMLTGSDVYPFLQNHIPVFIGISLLLWIIVTVLAGFYPAMVLSGVRPLLLFKKGKRSLAGMQGKNVLITFQFIISILLVILTLMVTKQYRHMAQMPLGFDNKMVMQIPLTNHLKSNYSSLKDELTKIAGIKDLCAASSMPAGIPNHSGVIWTDDKGEQHDESFAFAIVSEGYTQTFDMKLALGNEFVAGKPEDLNGLLINETAARYLGFENPVGKQIRFWGRESTIIGVVNDFQNNYLFNRVKPMVMSAHPKNQGFTKFLFVSLAPGNIESTLKEVEKTIKQISPDFPFEYNFTNAETEAYINEIKEINHAFSFASIISIFLATIGLVALSYHATQMRIKEIGIRKVNGAKSIELVKLLNGSLARNIVIAYAIACPIAWMIVHRLLQGIENRTTISAWIFLFAGVLVGAVAMLTVSVQSWQAARRNPVEALRYE